MILIWKEFPDKKIPSIKNTLITHKKKNIVRNIPEKNYTYPPLSCYFLNSKSDNGIISL